MRRANQIVFALTDAAGLESRLRGGFSAATSIRFAPSVVYARGHCETRHPVHKFFGVAFHEKRRGNANDGSDAKEHH